MKIEKIYLKNMRNGVHFQFHTEVRDLIQKVGAESLKITEQFSSYLSLYNMLDNGLKKINKSVITEQIVEADKARDDIWYGILEMNKTAFRHFDIKVREAAKRLKILFDTYGSGELANKSIKEQTSFTNNILQDLQGKYATDTELVEISKWIAELKVRNNNVNKLVKERYDEAVAKGNIVVKRARLELDRAYKTIVERINAFVVIEGSSSFETFIKTLNIIISDFVGKQVSASSATDGGNMVAPPAEPTEPEPIDPFANAREWKHSVKAGDFKLGDICYIAEPNVPKKYYELIDEEHYIYFPNSDEGTLAWKRLV